MSFVSDKTKRLYDTTLRVWSEAIGFGIQS